MTRRFYSALQTDLIDFRVSALSSVQRARRSAGQATRLIAGIFLLSFLVLAGPLLSSRASASAQGVSVDSFDFGSIAMGSVSSGQVVVSNNSDTDITVLDASITSPQRRSRRGGSFGGGASTVFSVVNASFPMTVFAGQSAVLTIAFSPSNVANYTGLLTLDTDAPDSPTTSQITGSGVTETSAVASDAGGGTTSTGLLNASSTNLNFGSAAVGGSSALVASVTNVGNADVTVSDVTISGAGFSASGVSSGQVLSPGQTASLSLTFNPSVTGTSTGTLTISSDAVGLPVIIAVTGNGTQSTAHAITLTWTPSTSTVSGYNVYRSSVAGGPYAPMNGAPITNSQYVDSAVEMGQSYFYVATCVDSNNVESVYSDETSATVPGT